MKKRSQQVPFFWALSFLAALAALPAAPASSPDAAAARWVIRMGGSVTLEGQNEPIADLAGLPSTPFFVTMINLVGVLHEPAELARLEGLTRLRQLHLSGRTWHNRPAPQVA